MKKIVWFGLAAATFALSVGAIIKRVTKKTTDKPQRISEEKLSKTIAGTPSKTIAKPKRRTPQNSKINPKEVSM